MLEEPEQSLPRAAELQNFVEDETDGFLDATIGILLVTIARLDEAANRSFATQAPGIASRATAAPWVDGHGEPRCIAFGGLRVDDTIEDALLAVVGPGAIAEAVAVETEVKERRDQVRDALSRSRSCPLCSRSRLRPYAAADPANRLVAGELEARWNTALARVAGVQARSLAMMRKRPYRQSIRHRLQRSQPISRALDRFHHLMRNSLRCGS